MTTMIVPNYISEAIYRKVDELIATVPERDKDIVAKERELFYGVLLNYFDQYGVIPEASLKPSPPAKEPQL